MCASTSVVSPIAATIRNITAVYNLAVGRPPRRKRDLEIVYEDKDLLVINKPAGLLAVPLERRAGALSVFDQIEEHLRSHGKRKPLVVHRIDRDTSGLVIFAKRTEAQARLKAQFKRREPVRVYLAVVQGHPDPVEGTWRDRLVWDSKALIQKRTHPRDRRGVDAVSHYRVLESFADASLVEIRLETGKRNQIRIQAQLRGHPLIGERRYVSEEAATPVDIAFSRQALHAHRLAFQHPTTGRPVSFEAPIPNDLTDLLKRLKQRRNRVV